MALSMSSEANQNESMAPNEHNLNPAETISQENRQGIDAGLETATGASGSSGNGAGETDTSKRDDPTIITLESCAQASESKPTVKNDVGKKDSEATLQDVLDAQRDILNALQSSTIAGPTGKGVQAQFWSKYKKVAEEHDTEFLERYNGDMDIVLIFSGLFSAVSTSFIVAMESNLSPTASDQTNALLTQLVQIALGDSTATGNAPAEVNWPGPSHAQVWIQSIAYVSLSTSLLAAFGAVLGKQWLGYYKSSRYGRGSIEERSKRRQEKLDGITQWYFDAVVQTFPVLIQLSLFLFAIALGANMWLQQQTIGSVIIAMTVLGFLFYACTVIVSLITPACPFQTPVSTVLRLAKVDGPLVATLHIFQDVLLKIHTGAVALWGKLQFIQSARSHYLALIGKATIVKGHFAKTRSWWKSTMAYIGRAKSKLLSHVPRTQRDLESGPTLEDQPGEDIKSEEPDLVLLDINSLPVGQLDAPSVKWLLDTSTDPEVFLAAVRMVPEIDWPLEVDVSATIAQLVDSFMHCFDLQDRIVTGTEERALAYILAATHLIYEYHSSDVDHSKRDQFWCDNLCSSSFVFRAWDQDRRFKLLPLLVDSRAYWHFDPTDVTGLSRSDYLWVSHILPHIFYIECISDSCRIKLVMSDDKQLKTLAVTFVSRLLEPNSLPPSHQIIANCAVIVGFVLGLRFDPKDLKRIDKSSDLPQLGIAVVTRLYAVLPHTGPDSYEWQCIPLISRILELSPPLVTELDTKGVDLLVQLQHNTLLADKVVANWQSNREPHSVQEATDYLIATLRIAVVVGGGGIYQPDDLAVLWWGKFSKLSSATTDLLADFLVYLCKDSHKYPVAIGDLLLVLSGSQGTSNLQRYLEVITICMGEDQPQRVRLAALRAAASAGSALVEAELDESTSERFSQVLLTTTSDSDEPNRYESYSSLLYTLAKNSIWTKRLSETGHTKFCADQAIKRFAHSYYLLAAIARMWTTSSTEVAPYMERLWSPLLRLWHRWSWLVRDNDDDEVNKVIPDILRFTVKCMPADYDAKKRSENVEKALSGLESLRLEVQGHLEHIAALDELTDLLLGKRGTRSGQQETLAGNSVADTTDL